MTSRLVVWVRNILALTAVVMMSGADWPQFRGVDNASLALDANPPVQWEPADAAWSISLPGRCVSGPIVVQNQVITTSSSGRKNERLHVWSIDKNNGKLRWHRSLWATGRTLCHPLTSMASPTPASDGKHVFVLFASNDLVCLDLKGNVVWLRAIGMEHPQAFDDRGLGSSPLLVDGTIVLQIECQGDSLAMGIDVSDGQTLWRKTLPSTINWLSPATFRQRGKGLALLQTTDRLLILEPRTGNVIASYETPGSSIASPVAGDGMIFMPSKGLTALRYTIGASEPDFVWQENRLGARNSSPVVAHGKLYVIRSPNVLAWGDAKTGGNVKRLRMKGKQFWATPVVTSSHLYAASADGLIQVVDIQTDQPKVVASINLGEEILGSPAVSESAIYVRGVSTLWKFK